MPETISASLAMVNVLESWGVDHVYGVPGGSFNSTMDALYEKRTTVRFIQVRHEETGALAASADAKLTGTIGVCFGSAGPGATHLFNGLYDAKMDHAPVLALIGQVASTAMNHDAFQELNENPMFADVSIYNRTVMDPESLPYVVDEAIRRALEQNGVAVVTIPVDYGYAAIKDSPRSTARNHRTGIILPDDRDIAPATALIAASERLVLYVGQGIRGAADAALQVSERFSMPIVSSVLAKGIIPDNTPQYLGSAARLATKPANEALAAADLILFVGSNFPFTAFLPPKAKFIQVDNKSSALGRRHATDVAIFGDAGEVLRRLAATGASRPSNAFFEACKENKSNWQTWLQGFANSTATPLRVEPVFREINRIATKDAIFIADVGDSTIHAVRLLEMNGQQRFTTSGWFATMGYGVPGGIAAKLSLPGRQVFTLNGDGAFAMSMQDILTQVKYGLPVINVVFSNGSLGFIEAEQEDTNKQIFGIDLQGADFAKAAEAMGAAGFSVTSPDQLPDVFDQAAASPRPVVIDVKIESARPFPAEAMRLDPEQYSPEAIAAFKQRYQVTNMPLLKDLMKGPAQ